MKAMTATELAAVAIPEPMTKRDKLLRWAQLIDGWNRPVVIFHRVEYHDDAGKAKMSQSGSAFDIAFNDPVFQAGGLKGSDVRSGQTFFELTNHELHRFSCDCGGNVSNYEMASRIRQIAG